MSERNCYLFFAGYYMVLAASQALCRHNIENRVVKAPAHMRQSCSFALLLDGRDEKRSLGIFAAKKINVLNRVYR